MNENIKAIIEKYVPGFDYNQENDICGEDAQNNNRGDLMSFVEEVIKEYVPTMEEVNAHLESIIRDEGKIVSLQEIQALQGKIDRLQEVAKTKELKKIFTERLLSEECPSLLAELIKENEVTTMDFDNIQRDGQWVNAISMNLKESSIGFVIHGTYFGHILAEQNFDNVVMTNSYDFTSAFDDEEKEINNDEVQEVLKYLTEVLNDNINKRLFSDY